ncbi:MAG: RecQ family ATP-dependent DNA helicase [Chryseobacterium sp.]|uniref:RecQ family ATP-dependent DNA helicase n=1 Tax=Chryseobacterium sp. TaxID=1871047 RepID=UPI0028308D55|nr:RecQ family ATP-dependent DNA helicase [Chryseobacterium sp.]MDR2235302.1 RecQ family ATP-dependent DNA helicase [Chryseobacterium sp.]
MIRETEHTGRSIAFIDTEIEPKNLKILDIGGIKNDGNIFHKNSVTDFIRFLSNTEFICGHNIFNHDMVYIGKAAADAGVHPENVIDTLYLSPLLFPTKPYHSLLKDDKLQTDELNNPLHDSIKAKDLFYAELTAFRETDQTLKQIFYLLLKDRREFNAFFRYTDYSVEETDVRKLILIKFKDEICEHADLAQLISEYPVELAYSLSLTHSFIEHQEIHSITPPWVLKNYPETERIMFLLRNRPCIPGCFYCNRALDIHKGLKKFFDYNSFRKYGGEALQEKAVKAAVDNKSLLAVFPTGGGKSITFQVPALISAETAKGLTVIISPLQSLMKDQVDNLEKIGITEAVTINGLLDEVERGKSFERIEDGSASILYISPESLRSKSIEKLILGRKIVRFVIDEAHCFSAWGQDFRVDYLYIGDFIRSLQEKKNLEEGIPVSCFTATARQKVIQDIRDYFKEKLDLDLELFTSKASRNNLHYKVYEKADEEEKYQAARDLIEGKNCPTIIYVSKTKKAFSLAERLAKDGFSARPYHGKMEKQEKSANQDSFIAGETQIMVATSAFGMGVDKKDVGMVIHYEISNSLENYVQEAGRAGRDENITADCFVLFNEEDLGKHFILLNQNKVSIKEIQQIWKAIKDITRFRYKVSNSALEIARKAGWDDSVIEIETRVTTAIAALEDAGYLKRGQNMPRIFANSILARNAQEAIDKINASEKFIGTQKEHGVRIIKKLFSSKSRKQSSDETAESRVDYISDRLGIVKEKVINIINLLREEGILADTRDLTAFIKSGENRNRSLTIVEAYAKIENFLLPLLEEQQKEFHLKQLNEDGEKNGCEGINTARIKTIVNFWAIKNWVKRQPLPFSKNHLIVGLLHPEEELKEKLKKRHELARFIVELLYEKSSLDLTKGETGKEEVLVEFSVHELKDAYNNSSNLFKMDIDIHDIEDTLFYLSRIEAIKIEGGFLVLYNRLTIERTEQDNKKRYTKDDYQKLQQFYENKVQQIHIVGEYAKKMISSYQDALQFAEDYFQLNYTSFLNKYFNSSRQEEIRKNLTPAKFRQLFGELSPTQLKIIKDNETRHIAVAAGPGSGKTRVLVHKLASLLTMEDVKQEQLLMLTFSRAAATEFKKRLIRLIGNSVLYIDIKTFHSYCFDLLGKVGTIEKSEIILRKTIEKIRNGEVEASKITKTVLVIDEAQDMDSDEFELINALMEQNEEMRVIAVGDDDQNIYEFRGASSKYLEQFITVNNAVKYELIENYRSKSNLVELSNQFVKQISHRLKETPIIARQTDNGKIKIVKYQNANLITPLVDDLLNTGLQGTTCVLTKTNDEALQVTGLLLKKGIHAELIQTNDAFSLYHIAEIRFFLNLLNRNDQTFTISDHAWDHAKRELINSFRHSTQLDSCLRLIKDFETVNPKTKYKSDLEVFIRESRLEDFFSESGETVFVSTIHKAKGKEFDHVFLLLENFHLNNDQDKRQLYVAMTRAKRDLTIHINSDLLDHISAENMERVEDRETHSPPHLIAMHLTYKDVWLDYFIGNQSLISQLRSGDHLIVSGTECFTPNGQSVLKFSQQFRKTIDDMKSKNFELVSVKVNFIVYWLKEGSENEIKVILPEVYFQKSLPFTPNQQ